MTEAEWGTCRDAPAMLRFVRGKCGERKLRLLACACARTRWSGLIEDEYRRAVEVAERYADGLADRGDLDVASDDIWTVGWGRVRSAPDARGAAWATVYDFAGDAASVAMASVAAATAGLVREIIGNPFRAAAAVHLTSGGEPVTELARRIYDERRFEGLPRLADLLNEVGCRDEALLAHLRSAGPHFRGCWALDALLAKGQGKSLVTEAEWRSETHPFRMLTWWEYFRGKPSARKQRLLACACCRLIWHLMTDECLVRAVETAEAYADGLADAAELARSHSQARALGSSRGEVLARMSGRTPEKAAQTDLWRAAHAAAEAAGSDDDGFFRDAMEHVTQNCGRGWDTEDPGQATLIREILGSPLRQATIEPEWRTTDVLALARSIHDGRAFDLMPILADALQDAGCDDDSILDHCRGEETHVLGCWVVDLILGNS